MFLKLIFKSELKNFKLLITLVLLFFLYFIIFLTQILIFNTNIKDSLYFESENKSFSFVLIFTEKQNWVLWYFLIPILIINGIISSKNLNFINFHFFKKQNKFREQDFKNVFLWFLSYFLYSTLLIFTFNILFFLLAFGFFVQNNLVVKLLLVLFYITIIEVLIYILLGFLIYSFFAVFNLKIFLFTIVTSLLVTCLMNLIFSFFNKTDSTESISIEYNYEEEQNSINYSLGDIFWIAKYQNTNFYKKYLNNLDKSKDNLILNLEKKHIENFCSYLDAEIYLKDNQIQYICKISTSTIQAEFERQDGINLIWINSVTGIDAKIKFENIFNKIDANNLLEKNLNYLESTLGSMYPMIEEENFKNIIPLVDFTDNGDIWLGQGVIPDEYLNALEEFLKVLFYYYLIEYINNPFGVDPITTKSYSYIFNNFLTTTQFENRIFIEIFNEFMWTDQKSGINQNELDIFHKNNYKVKNIDLYFQNFINSKIYLEIFDTNNFDTTIIEKLNSITTKKKKWSYINILNYQNYAIEMLLLNNFGNIFQFIKKDDDFINKIITIDQIKLESIDSKYFLNGTTSDSKNILYIYILVYFILMSISFLIFYLSIKLKFVERVNSRTYPIIF